MSEHTRCVVCGDERTVPDGWSSKHRRVPATGEIAAGVIDKPLRRPDGSRVTACIRHTADEVRTAFVLAGFARDELREAQ